MLSACSVVQWSRWPASDLVLDAGTLGMLLCSALLGWTHHTLGTNWSPVITVSDLSRHTLITSG